MSDIPAEDLALIYNPESYKAEFVPGEVLIGMKHGFVAPANLAELFLGLDIVEIEDIFKSVDARHRAKMREAGILPLSDQGENNFTRPTRTLYKIKLASSTRESVIEAIKILKQNPCVAYAQPNYISYPLTTNIYPNDWNARGADPLWGLERIQAPAAWNISTGSRSVRVGVLDSGIDHNHSDLAANIDRSNAFFVAQGTYGLAADTMDYHGHGTHVAGTIGAVGNNNGTGVVGVNWNVTMVPIKIANSNTDANSSHDHMTIAVRHATNQGLPIINMSYSLAPDNQPTLFDQALYNAVKEYKGLFIISAGNSNLNRDNYLMYERLHALGNVIFVANLAQTNIKFSGSCYGVKTVALAAPGVNILSTRQGTYLENTGSSMAAPHVAGAAALLKAHVPSLTTQQIKDAILNNVDVVPALRNFVTTSGYLNVYKAIASFTSVPPTPVPGAPTSVTATAGNWQASINWQPPASTATAITGYQATRDNVSWTSLAATARTHTFTGLNNGTAYTLRVRAVFAAGNGAPAGPGAAVVPPPVTPAATVPGLPTNVTATPGNGQATINWQPPATESGSAITGYQVSRDGTNWTSVAASLRTYTFTGLTNGTAVTLRVRAVNAVGNGAIASAQAVTPRTVPGVPTSVTATAGNAQATINWLPPASNGGSAITGYEVSHNGATWISAASAARTYTFIGLNNGTAYTLRVRAVNAAGSSAIASAQPVTPSAPPVVPGAPTSVTATAGNGQATINWQSPASSGSSAITAYQVSRDGTNWTSVAATARTHTFTGLANGTAVTLRVRAVNAAGNGAIANASAVTPVAPASVPGVPTNVTAAPGNGQATIIWQPPASSGSSAITAYQVSRDGTNWTNVAATARTHTFTGLTNGMAVTLRVRAVNATGNGATANAPAVTPAAPASAPGVPSSVTATPGNGQATINWQPPANVGSSAITGYQVSIDLTNWTSVAASVRTRNFTGLVNGTAVLLHVRAVNAAGNGPIASVLVTPRTVPGTPASVTSTFGNAQATINWQPPASNGGSAITGYQVSRDNTNWASVATTARTHTFTGLTNGTAVTLRVRAVNEAGNGAAIAAPAVTPGVVPSVPTSVTATPGNGQAAINWQPPANVGSPAITGYQVSSDGTSWTRVAATVRTRNFTRLTNGTALTLRVYAVNAIGNGPVASVLVTPRTVPGAPASVTSTFGNAQATINWQPPASNGGSAITGYQISRDNTNWTSVTATARSHSFTGLTNGTAVTLRVRAVNEAGNGAAVAAPAVTPGVVPGVPTSVTATPGNGQAAINWQPPANVGSSAITAYQVSSNGTSWTRVAATVRTRNFTRLTNGTALTLRVYAVNAIGNGPVASVLVTPRTVPGAPASVTATAGNGQATINWQPPASNGGSAITGYQVSRDNTNWTSIAASVRTHTFTGLTSGTAVTLRVRAVNEAGNGAAAAASSVRP